MTFSCLYYHRRTSTSSGRKVGRGLRGWGVVVHPHLRFHPRIYNTHIAVGSEITGTQSLGSDFGNAIALSGDGRVLVVGGR